MVAWQGGDGKVKRRKTKDYYCCHACVPSRYYTFSQNFHIFRYEILSIYESLRLPPRIKCKYFLYNG